MNEHPTSSLPNAGARISRLHDELVGRTRPLFLLLGGAALVLLIIGTANVAALLLARTARRSGELALRIALGCSAGRLVRGLVVEHLALAGLGGIVAVVISAWTVPVVRSLVPQLLPRAGEIRFDLSVVAFAAAVSLAAGLVFGVPPAVEALASLIPGDLDVGERVRIAGTWREVIGVVGDVTELGEVRAGVIRQPGFKRLTLPAAYVPSGTVASGSQSLLVVRTALPVAQVAEAIRREVHSTDPTAVIRRMSTLDERVSAPSATARFAGLGIAAFGLVALLLAALGLYGLLAQSVSERTREIGLRMALGAQAANVLWTITSRTLGLVAAGLGAGVTAALATGRVMRPWLFEPSPTDRAVLAGVVLALLILAFLAAYLPARRATRVEPMAVLRSE